jgi:formylglycine-generating enzyme required for sulfatase activity
MVCVPGGAFLLGNPHLLPGAAQALPEHLIRVDPFAMDIDEFTVGQMRMLVNAQGLAEPVRQQSETWAHMCSYLSASDPSNDAMPLSCIDADLASQACEILGKRLPTEAEWEFAAGNLDLETYFPWGEDGWGDSDAICARAVVARSEDDGTDMFQCRSANGINLPAGPVAGGAATDVTLLGIRNLGGNLNEWMSDMYWSYSATCWNPNSGLLVNPHCDISGPNGLRSVRGGSWFDYPFAATVFVRNSSLGEPTWNTGFRCVRSM